jgi:hypothetical protein
MLLPLAACLEDDRPRVCTLIGCESGAQFGLGLFPDSDAARLTGARIEVCFLGTCEQRVLDTVPAPHEVDTVGLSSPGEPNVAVTLTRFPVTGIFQIDLSISSPDHELFDDGDIYTISVIGSDGSTIVDRGWSVTYRTWDANGPRCGPTCRYAMTTTEL